MSKFSKCCNRRLIFETYKNYEHNKIYDLSICNQCGNIKIITESGNKLNKSAADTFLNKYANSKKIEINDYKKTSKISFPDFRYFDGINKEIQNEYYLSTNKGTSRKHYSLNTLNAIGKILFLNIMISKEKKV